MDLHLWRLLMWSWILSTTNDRPTLPSFGQKRNVAKNKIKSERKWNKCQVKLPCCLAACFPVNCQMFSRIFNDVIGTCLPCWKSRSGRQVHFHFTSHFIHPFISSPLRHEQPSVTISYVVKFPIDFNLMSDKKKLSMRCQRHNTVTKWPLKNNYKYVFDRLNFGHSGYCYCVRWQFFFFFLITDQMTHMSHLCAKYAWLAILDTRTIQLNKVVLNVLICFRLSVKH